MATDVETRPTYDVEVRDLEYQRVGDTPLLARLYQPQGTGPFPALLDVHGGVWTSGTRKSNEPIDQALAASGVVVLAIDFRQPPEAGYPDSIADVNLGIRWLKAHASELNGRPGSVGGLGSSSGGHQVMLAALRPRDSRYAALALPGTANLDASLKYVVLCWPIVDPSARYRMAKEKGRENLVRGHDAYWRTEEAMAEGNPQLILERGEAADLPPALLIQGTDDANVTPDMADRFAAAYREAGGEIQLEKFEGEPHGFIKKDLNAPAAARALELMKSFIHDRASETRE